MRYVLFLFCTVTLFLPVHGSSPAKKTTATSSAANQSQPTTNAPPINVTVNPFPVTIANPPTNVTATLVTPSKDQPIFVHLDYKQPDGPSPYVLVLLPALITLAAGIVSAIFASTILNRSQELLFRRKKLEELYVSHTKASKQVRRRLLYIVNTLRNPVEHGEAAIAEMNRVMAVDFGPDAEMEMLTNIYYPNLTAPSERIVSLFNASDETVSTALATHLAGGNTDEYRTSLTRDIERIEALEEEFNRQLFSESVRLNFVSTWKIWENFARS